MNLILGIAIGLGIAWLIYKTKNGWVINWFGWVLMGVSASSFVFGVDLFFDSIIEHEMRAGWMGFGLFSIVLPVVLGTIVWHYSIVRSA